MARPAGRGTDGLTDQQRAFAVSVGRDDMRPVEAYIKHYGKAATEKSSAEMASRLRWKPAVMDMITELRRRAGEEAKVTMGSHIKKLQELRDQAYDEGKVAAAIRAEELIGKASGLYVEQVQHSGNVSINLINEFPD
jgi:hypothetical protein